LVGERTEWEKKIKITGDKSTIFKRHAPTIKKKNMINNKMKWQKHIFNYREASHEPCKICGTSHASASFSILNIIIK